MSELKKEYLVKIRVSYDIPKDLQECKEKEEKTND